MRISPFFTAKPVKLFVVSKGPLEVLRFLLQADSFRIIQGAHKILCVLRAEFEF
jgi:hypothetical protein